MANKRIKDISTASTSFASDDFVITDSATSGTRKMTKDNLISQVSAGVSGDYLEESNNLSDVADKNTAKLNLEVPNVGSAANEVSLNGMLNSGAWLDFDAFYETGTWTPTVTFGGSSTGIALTSEGIYTRIGNTVTIHGVITFTDKGGESGSARITGLPFTAANTNGSYQCGVIGFASNLLSLVGTPTFAVADNGTELYLQNWSATDSVNLTNSNFKDNTSLRFSATYQIA